MRFFLGVNKHKSACLRVNKHFYACLRLIKYRILSQFNADLMPLLINSITKQFNFASIGDGQIMLYRRGTTAQQTVYC